MNASSIMLERRINWIHFICTWIFHCNESTRDLPMHFPLASSSILASLRMDSILQSTPWIYDAIDFVLYKVLFLARNNTTKHNPLPLKVHIMLRYNSFQCVFRGGRGWKTGGYDCVCKDGFYSSTNSSFSGTLVEGERCLVDPVCSILGPREMYC